MNLARRARLLLPIVVVTVAANAAPALACSTDDTSWFDNFPDTSCLGDISNVELDALGGLRLTTNGVPTTAKWDTDTEFAAAPPATTVPFGLNTLATNGLDTAATLVLPTSPLPLTRDVSAAALLGPSASTVGDGDGVDDPTMIKIGALYVMYYTGYPEDGGPSAIYRATSANGQTWTKDLVGGVPRVMLAATAAAFDEHGVYAPEVFYDASDATTPYRMYYTGRGRVFDAIGLATSTDGITWAKTTDGVKPVPVVDHGAAGSADTFAAADPSVLKDGATFKMWYTGDDSSKRRIAYATSEDGLHWRKGGKVIAPEDSGTSANVSFGVWAPTVWKDGTGFHIRLAGRKIVGGTDFQPKILGADSPDGIVWSGPSPIVNTLSNSFYATDLDAPEALVDGNTVKLYFSGVAADSAGNAHPRIGLDGFTGSGAGGSVIDISPPPAADPFDARSTSGVAAVKPAGATPAYYGVYTGVRGSDFKPRLGKATSSDGEAWTPVDGTQEGGSLLGLPAPAGAFDKGGQSDPSLLDDTTNLQLYFTGTSASGATSIGYATAPVSAGVVGTWTKTSTAILGTGAGSFESVGVSHPSVIKDGATYVMYYAGTGSSGLTGIGRATSATASFASPVRSSTPVLSPTAATFDADGVKDPVVAKLAVGSYVMAYTGIEVVGAKRIERIGIATSADGVTWAKQGIWLGPSQVPYSFDETGMRPAGLLVDGATLRLAVTGVDRSGRTRGGVATVATVAPAGKIPSAWSTYQFGDPTSAVQDFRSITRTSLGAGLTLWMSFLQPYSSAGKEFWSDFFPVTGAAGSPVVEDLNFLLTVRGVRWQARLSTAADALDKVEIAHAPVAFATAGSAHTTDIAPPPAQATSRWTTLTVASHLFQPNGSGSGSGTVKVLDAANGAELSSTPIDVTNATSSHDLDLSAIDPAAHPKLRLGITLGSDSFASPVLESLKVRYNAAPIVPPPPPPPPDLTLSLKHSRRSRRSG
jgi:predicted GH43/DUF377 family glycosyl hydrolase